MQRNGDEEVLSSRLRLSSESSGSFSRSSSVVAVILRSAGVAHLGLSEPVCERRDA